MPKIGLLAFGIRHWALTWLTLGPRRRVAQPLGHGGGNRMGAPRVGMPIPREVPGGVEVRPDVPDAALVEDPLPEPPLHRRLVAELGNDDERRRAARPREFGRRAQNLARHHDPALDGLIASKRDQEL